MAFSSSRIRLLRGLVFDMDGTLTVPAIDFDRMHRAVLGDDHPRFRSVSSCGCIDILQEIQEWCPDKQRTALSIIAHYEQEANKRLQIMPGALELCEFLDANRLRRGLITRNMEASVELFHTRFGMKEFSPALSREFRPYKPSPAPLLHICSSWAVPPEQVMMIGDSLKDDIVCGNRAGALTCLLLGGEAGRHPDVTNLPCEEQPNFKVESLFDVPPLLQSSFEFGR